MGETADRRFTKGRAHKRTILIVLYIGGEAKKVFSRYVNLEFICQL